MFQNVRKTSFDVNFKLLENYFVVFSNFIAKV